MLTSCSPLQRSGKSKLEMESRVFLRNMVENHCQTKKWPLRAVTTPDQGFTEIVRI